MSPRCYTLNGNAYCSGFLPTSITNAVGTAAIAWDCNGAVPTKITDYNSQSTLIAYDSRWRETSVTDPESNVTSAPPTVIA